MYSGQQRSARAVSDAQMNALLGLHAIEQDLRMAGHGMAVTDVQSCASPRTFYGNSAATAQAPIADFSTGAVTITDGGSGPDTVIVRYAESVRGAIPVELYGRDNYGVINGALAAPVLLAKAAGPLVAALALLVAPDYDTVALLLAAIAAASLVFFAQALRPRSRA